MKDKRIEKVRQHCISVCVVIAVIGVFIALFFGLGGIDYIARNMKSGVAYLTVFSEDDLLSADEYTVTSELDFENQKNGYKSDVGYGEIRGIIHLPEDYEIEYGFVNTNNWHNIQIRIDVNKDNGQFMVKQTVSYETDNDVFEVMVTEGISKGKKISVFRGGV